MDLCADLHVEIPKKSVPSIIKFWRNSIDDALNDLINQSSAKRVYKFFANTVMLYKYVLFLVERKMQIPWVTDNKFWDIEDVLNCPYATICMLPGIPASTPDLEVSTIGQTSLFDLAYYDNDGVTKVWTEKDAIELCKQKILCLRGKTNAGDEEEIMEYVLNM